MRKALALLLLTALLFSSACAETSATPPPEDVSPFVTDAKLARYDFETYGFSILLPENPDWTYEEDVMTVNDIEAIDAALRRTSNAAVSINLRMMDTGDPASDFADEAFLAATLAYYEKNGAEQIKHELRGDPAIEILYYRRKDADERKWQFYESVHNGVSVRLRYPTFGDGAEESAAVCKYMRDSIQWGE